MCAKLSLLLLYHNYNWIYAGPFTHNQNTKNDTPVPFPPGGGEMAFLLYSMLGPPELATFPSELSVLLHATHTPSSFIDSWISLFAQAPGLVWNG